MPLVCTQCGITIEAETEDPNKCAGRDIDLFGDTRAAADRLDARAAAIRLIGLGGLLGGASFGAGLTGIILLGDDDGLALTGIIGGGPSSSSSASASPAASPASSSTAASVVVVLE